ncbi:hypothetical protein J437_LFUL017318 [Ladona fulva]|uniref:G-protein coupled receptors family 2 profile 2 domain-containing protein n=1 Tax=Ladona fulva TaxID=123851 RepID=A0A8K0KRJ7_LADFU|nr:hypothetical protein J437_LFUL017318 [Ladona fulva]
MVKAIARVGYSVSLGTILVAFIIMASIKKLRCPRNMLHMHLFASFMMRAFMSLLKDSLLVEGLGLSSDVIVQNGDTFNIKEGQHSWECKLVVSLWQFFIMANYSWVLMEGLYLHNLIFLALFSDTSSITLYVILGWGLPILVVVPWVILRAILEDTHCWTTNDNPLFFLVIRIPTVISILLNFLLFVNIVRVLLSKLQSSISEESRKYRYRRWAKSTLVLVPLFGVHYTLFLGMSYSMGVNQVVEIIWLFCDQFFASFQGSFVAVLYCFMNGEVRAELNKIWLHYTKRRGTGHSRGQWWLSSGYADGSSSRRTSKAGGPLVTFSRRSRDGGEGSKRFGSGPDSDEKFSRTSSKSFSCEAPLQPSKFPRNGRPVSPPPRGRSFLNIGRLRNCWGSGRSRGIKSGVNSINKGKCGEDRRSAGRSLRVRLGIISGRYGKRRASSSPCTSATSYSCQTTRCSLDSGVGGVGHKVGRGVEEQDNQLWPPLLVVHDEQESPPQRSPLLQGQPSREGNHGRRSFEKDPYDRVPLKADYKEAANEDWKAEIDAISYMDKTQTRKS